LDCLILGRSFDSAVPAQVVVRTVAILLAVGLVVLGVVRDEVVQGEAVVARHEVDALFRFPFLMAEEVRASQKPRRDYGYRARVALKKPSSVTREPAVPLLPRVADEAADLVEAGGIPRFGNQFGAREVRI